MEAKEGYEEQLGRESEKALDLTCALIMATTMCNVKIIEKLRDLVKRCERALGEENVVTLETLNQLGNALKDNKEYEEAKEVHERCLAGRMKVLGEDRKETLDTLNNLGIVYGRLNNYEKALEYYERALKAKERTLGKNHPKTLRTVMNISIDYAMKGDLQEAEFYFRKVVDGNVAQLGNDHFETKRSVGNLAQCLTDAGNTKGLQELKEEYPWLDEKSDDEEESEEDESDNEEGDY